MSQKGMILYLAIVIMGILLGIGIGLNTIVLSQVKIFRGIGDSILALSGADTGIEKSIFCLFYSEDSTACGGCRGNPSEYNFSCSGTLGEISYSATTTPATTSAGSDCPKPPIEAYCIKSTGSYKGTRRSVDASY